MAFQRAFEEGGGKVLGADRMPVANADFSSFVQRAKDANPDAVFVFVPGGKDATAIMKVFGDLGLKAAGIKMIGPGDISTDEELAITANGRPVLQQLVTLPPGPAATALEAAILARLPERTIFEILATGQHWSCTDLFCRMVACGQRPPPA